MGHEKGTGDGDEGEDQEEKDLPKKIYWKEGEAIEKAHLAKMAGSKGKKRADFSKDLSPMETKLLEARLEHFVETPHPSSDEVFKKNREAFLAKYQKDPAYLPPSDRLLLNRDISYDSRRKRAQEASKIAMFCDLQNSRKEKINPRGFQYITQSTASPRVRPRELEYLKICCTCDGPCKEKTCNCLGANALINKTPISLHEGRVVVEDPTIDTSSYILVCCGPECGCPSSCPNRAENLVSSNRFEVFRRDSTIGFGVRTLSTIHFGEIVAEFVGDIIDEYSCSEDSNPWTMELDPNGGESIMDSLFCFLDGEISQEAWNHAKPKTKFVVDVSKRANFTRFFSHGCHPNLQLLRVISNFVAVPFHKLFFFASRAIPAGSEIFIDYGRNFAAQLDCRCGTPLCEKEELLKSFSRPQLLALMKELHCHWLKVAKAKEARMGQGREESSRSPAAVEVITIDDSDDVEQRPHLEYNDGEDRLHSTEENDSDDSINVQRRLPEKEPIDCITLDDSDEEDPHQPNEIATYWPPGQREPPMGWAKFCAMQKKKLTTPPPLPKSSKLREATAPKKVMVIVGAESASSESPEGHLQKTSSIGEVGARLAAGAEGKPSVGIEATPRSHAESEPSDVLLSEAKPSATPIGLNEGISAGETEPEATIIVQKDAEPILTEDAPSVRINNPKIDGSEAKLIPPSLPESRKTREGAANGMTSSIGGEAKSDEFRATPSSTEATSLEAKSTGDQEALPIRAKPNESSSSELPPEVEVPSILKKGIMKPPPLPKPRILREATAPEKEATPNDSTSTRLQVRLTSEKKLMAPNDSSTSQAVRAEENASPSSSPPSKKQKASVRGVESARKSASGEESQSREEAPNTTAHVVLIDLTVDEDEASPPDEAKSPVRRDLFRRG